jgi:hypothetical protein
VPPHSDEAEQGVLGGLLLDNSAWGRVTEVLKADDFFHFDHKIIFGAIGALIGLSKPADVITVFDQLQTLGKAQEFGGRAYLNALAASVPSASSLSHYAGIVRRDSLHRAHIASTADAADKAWDSLPESATTDLPPWAARVAGWTPPDLNNVDTHVSFAVDGLIAAGKVGALVAAGGSGKTTLLLTLGACIALGRPFMGMAVKQGSFVLLSNDDSQQDLHAALAMVVHAMLLSPEEVAQVASKVRIISLHGLDAPAFARVDGSKVVPSDMASTLAGTLATIPDLVGVAIDTLRQFAGGTANDEEVVKITIGGGQQIATRTGAFVVVAHHTGKQNYREGITDQYAGSGSAAIADNSRFVLLLQTTNWADIEQQVQRTGQELGDPLVLRSTRGSLLVQPPPPIFLVRNGHSITRIAGQALTLAQQLDRRDVAILEAVREGCGTKNAVYARVGGKKAAVLQAVDNLLERGHLIVGGSRELVVSGNGAKHLEGAT